MSSNWSATVLTLFPEMFPGPLGISLLGKALEKNLWSLDVRDIRDHGIGIEKDILNWLGKPFFQVEDHLRRKYAGLGLGLAISYAMARQLGIEIAIESVPDRGTTVTISLAAAGITASHKRIAA